MDTHNGLNLSSMFHSLFSLPSRFVASVRTIDEALNHDLERHTGTITAAAMSNAGMRRMSSDTIPYEFVAMPGPWAFITSGYAFGLLAMAVLLNRIQHIVVPPHRSFAYRVIRSRRSIFHAIYYSFFPINLSSTTCRLILRVPSLFFLFKSLITLTIILMQSSGFYPSTNLEVVQMIGKWANEKEFADVCWSIFCAVCGALSVGALTRGLEGHSSSNSSPFNLFGYAFLLHIYSVPITHMNKGPPSRPDKHVLVTIVLPLLQLAMIHVLGIKKSWSRQRLIPTTICSVLTLVHFLSVLLTTPASYPLLNYLPCLLESLLVLVTVITCTLNALTQLLLEGAVRQPLFGHAESLAPKADEDFAVVLLRLGTASLEATRIAGLGNEVSSVVVGGASRMDVMMGQIGDGPMLELNRRGVASVPHGRKGKAREGFANEIKNVKAGGSDTDWWFNSAWLKELAKFGMGLVSVGRGAWRLFLMLTWYRWRGVGSEPWRAGGVKTIDTGTNADVNRSSTGPVAATGEAPDDDDRPYQRFLRGDPISDDEDDYDPFDESRRESTKTSPYESLHASDTEDENEEAEGENEEAVNLYTDFLDPTPSTSAPLLLAHMTTTSESPLTRKRYSQMLSGSYRRASGVDSLDQTEEWIEFVRDRRDAIVRPDEHEYEMNESRRNCVICTVEQREVICWPCRCLALCDDCRANLASRFPPSKHSCPCCRRSVEGYSRIYIP